MWLLLASAALLLCGFGPPRLVDREIGPTVRVSVGELRVWAESATTPELTAESYLLFDIASGRTLYAYNGATVRPPASLTKLMTALLVLERADLNAIVRILPEDLTEGATMGLAAGDEVSVTDLLWGILLPSGNDAATALARHVGGTVPDFVAAMNGRAQAMGLQETRFVNPHGLDADGHVSSARDMLTLTRALWAYPLFRQMVGTARAQWNGRELVNTNEWLTTFVGAAGEVVTGVKTGTTDNAGECLIASVEVDGNAVLLVIMGSSQRYADANALYGAFRANYTWDVADARALSVLNRVYDDEGRAWFVQPVGDVPSLLQHQIGGPQLRSFRHVQLPQDEAPVAGMEVGVLEWWAGDEQIGTHSLILR